jgi:hypothetical protein
VACVALLFQCLYLLLERWHVADRPREAAPLEDADLDLGLVSQLPCFGV